MTLKSIREASAFWDASALVPLCVQERRSAAARTRFRQFSQVVWWGSRVEVYSAACRLHREKRISDADKQQAVSRMQLLIAGWREILPDDEVRSLAFDSLEKYSLRAADAIQIAASLVWCDKRPSRRTFICGDRRLASAAESAGFTVLEVA